MFHNCTAFSKVSILCTWRLVVCMWCRNQHLPYFSQGKKCGFLSFGQIIEVMLCHGHFSVVHKHPSSLVSQPGLHSLVNVSNLLKLPASCYSWDCLKKAMYCRSSVRKMHFISKTVVDLFSWSNSIYMK